MREAGHSLGGSVDTREGLDDSVVGGTPPRTITADRRGFRVVAGLGREGGDRSHSARLGHRPGRPRVYGAAAAPRSSGLGSGAVACWRRPDSTQETLMAAKKILF